MHRCKLIVVFDTLHTCMKIRLHQKIQLARIYASMMHQDHACFCLQICDQLFPMFYGLMESNIVCKGQRRVMIRFKNEMFSYCKCCKSIEQYQPILAAAHHNVLTCFCVNW